MKRQRILLFLMFVVSISAYSQAPSRIIKGLAQIIKREKAISAGSKIKDVITSTVVFPPKLVPPPNLPKQEKIIEKMYNNSILDDFCIKQGTKKGFNNEDVKNLQRELNILNENNNLIVDGLFGAKTIAAFNKYNKNKYNNK